MDIKTNSLEEFVTFIDRTRKQNKYSETISFFLWVL